VAEQRRPKAVSGPRMSGEAPQALGSIATGVRAGDDVTAVQVAGRIIRTRLESVWTALRAASDGQADADCVHRLRVATRRAIASLDAFEGLAPAGDSRWFRRRLRRVRRAAGAARDLDVLANRIDQDAGSEPASTARRRLKAMLARQRPAAREPVVDVREHLVAADWTGRMERLLARLARCRDQEAFRSYGRRRLKGLIRRFFEHVRPRIRDAEEIHRLRIEGKRLRYALEIFSPVLPSRGRVKCQKALETLQDNLGTFTDHVAAAERLRRWSEHRAAAADRGILTSIRKTESGEAERARRVFLKWWTRSRRRDLERCFRRTLRKGSA